MAVIGSNAEALREGYQPKKIPVATQTEKEMMIEYSVTLVGQLRILETSTVVPRPKITPITPPVMLINTASVKNCISTSLVKPFTS
jgi:hypothetical protein